MISGTRGRVRAPPMRAGAEARLVAADPELAFIKGHLRGTFQRAISQALLVLDDRERMVYACTSSTA